MARYRKKPVEVDAFRLGEKYDGNASKLFKWMESFNVWAAADDHGDGTVSIVTKEGDMLANEGDYIIRGVKGEFYPCKPDIFEKTYEKIE